MSGLPAMIDPVQLAERGVRLAGRLPLKGMARLSEGAKDSTDEVEVDLEFRRSASGSLCEMVGSLSVRLKTVCQRCLGPMDIGIEARPHVVLLRPGEREDLVSSEADTLVIEHPLALSQLVEDELILVAPMYPAHPAGACPAGADTEAGQGRRNPFAVLKGLKQSGRT